MTSQAEPQPSRSTSISTETPTDASTPISVPSSGTSKLVPAAPPAVNAWGSSSLTSASTIDQINEPKEQKWPSTESAISTSSAVNSKNETSAISKQSSLSSKSKLSGKEKWVPFEAEIRISTNTNDNRNKKNNSNNNNGSNTNGKSNKKSNGQKSRSNNNNNNNNNSKKKDSSGNGSKQEGQTHKQNKRKDSTSGTSNANSHQSTNSSNGQKSTPKLNSAKLDVVSATNSLDKLKINEDTPEGLPNTPNEAFNKNSQYQHRHSESNIHNNFRQNSYNKRYPRHQNQDSYRHSVSGVPGYSNSPFIVPSSFNYGYSPYLNGFPQPQLPYAYKPKSSRSSSHSPARPDYNESILSNPLLPNQSFLPPNVLESNPFPYVQDPLTLVINQLNYYFSPDNLAKDTYLRKQMNSQGLVPLTKLIEFKRLNTLTGGDINMLYTALNYTPFLELVDDKVRVRERWEAWILPSDKRDAAGKDVGVETEVKKEDNEEAEVEKK